MERLNGGTAAKALLWPPSTIIYRNKSGSSGQVDHREMAKVTESRVSRPHGTTLA
jgi:hypothetical protein